MLRFCFYGLGIYSIMSFVINTSCGSIRKVFCGDLFNESCHYYVINYVCQLSCYRINLLGEISTEKVKAVLWILFWVAIFSIIEFINLQFLDLISHHNGWSMMWSVIFNLIMFPMLWLHYKRPGTALLLSIPIVGFLLWYFRVPVFPLTPYYPVFQRTT